MAPPQQSLQMDQPKRARGRPRGTTKANLQKTALRNVLQSYEVGDTPTGSLMHVIPTLSNRNNCNPFLGTRVENVEENNSIVLENFLLRPKTNSVNGQDVHVIGNTYTQVQLQNQGGTASAEDILTDKIYQTSVENMKIEKAVEFINFVKMKTVDNPRLFEQFQMFLYHFHLNTIDTCKLDQCMKENFSAYPEVISEFNKKFNNNGQLHMEAAYSLEPIRETNMNSKDDSVDVIVGADYRQVVTDKAAPTPTHVWNTTGSDLMANNEESEVILSLDSKDCNVLSADDIHKAKSIDELAMLCMQYLQILEDEDYETYIRAKSALADHYEKNKNLNPCTDPHCSSDNSDLKRVLDKILEGRPKQLEIFEAFYTSKNKFYGIPSSETRGSSTTIAMTSKSVDQDKIEDEISHKESCCSDETTTAKKQSNPRLFPSDCVKSLESGFDPLAVLTAQPVSARIRETGDPSKILEEKLRSALQLYYDEEKWKNELTLSLASVLVEVNGLRNFMLSTLGVSLFIRDTDDDDDDDYKEPNNGHRDAEPNQQVNVQQKISENGVFFSGSYSALPDTVVPPICSGRNDLDKEVLNDEYVLSRLHSKFKHTFRANEDERLDDYEDARYEVDMLLLRNAESIGVLQNISNNMSKMTEEELKNFQLDDKLGGSSIIHKKTIELLFNDEGIKFVTEGLKKLPGIFVPGVLKLLKKQDKEWIELRGKWNLRISNDQKRFIDRCNRKRKLERLAARAPALRESRRKM